MNILRPVVGAVVAFAATLFAAEHVVSPVGDAQRQKVETLMDVMRVERTLSQVVADAIAGQMYNRPEVEDYRDIYDEFFASTLSWKVLKDDVVMLYQGKFSDAELDAIIAFYQSTAGRRLLEAGPELADGMAVLVAQRLMDALPKLQERIQQRTIDLLDQGKLTE